ncbi:MAG: hypothetical protein JWN90_465 [Parcubacteria group bacterium]|nr:hypothetical protein [Parcubacteria group bacterium]
MVQTNLVLSGARQNETKQGNVMSDVSGRIGGIFLRSQPTVAGQSPVPLFPLMYRGNRGHDDASEQTFFDKRNVTVFGAVC